MIKSAPTFYKEIIQKFPYQPTQKQSELLDQLTHFIFNTNNIK